MCVFFYSVASLPFLCPSLLLRHAWFYSSLLLFSLSVSVSQEERWRGLASGFSSKPSLPVGEGSEKERGGGLKQKDTVIIIWVWCVCVYVSVCLCLCVWRRLWLFQGLFIEPGEVWEQHVHCPDLTLCLQTSQTLLEEAQYRLRQHKSARLYRDTLWE